jgi:hypothetical protein
MQPTQHKEFDSPAALTKWRDAQPAGTEILDISNHGRMQVVYYRQPEDSDTNRASIVNARVLVHLDATSMQRDQLGYSARILSKPVAQYSLIRNSVRNLKCFKGLSPMEITNTLDATLYSLGFVIVESYDARRDYGVGSRLIVRKEEV